MVVKASVSISNQQDSFARKLVEDGRFASLSAVVQRGLELVREETSMKEAELAALKGLLVQRAEGDFESIENGRSRTQQMIAVKKTAHVL